MKRFVPLCALMLCALVIGFGCGDDETTTITEFDTVVVTDTVPTPVLAKGYMTLLPVSGLKISGQKTGFSTATPSEQVYPKLHVNMYGVDAAEPRVDSVIVADSMASISTSPYYSNIGDLYAAVDYSNLADTQRFVSGDTIDIGFYAYNTVSSCQLTLLDYFEDRIVPVASAMPNLVDTDSSITITWNRVANADWYGIAMYYSHAGSGTVATYNTYDYTHDTTYVIPGSETKYDGYITFNIMSATGPSRDATLGNIYGGAVAGTVYGYTGVVGFRVSIGTGVPAVPPAAKGLPFVVEETVDDTPVDGRDIIEAITER